MKKNVIRISQLKKNAFSESIYDQNRDSESLIESIRKYGLITDIVIDEHNNIISGNRRVAAAIALGMTHIRFKRIVVSENVKEVELVVNANEQRERTAVEKWNEIEALRKFYGKRQGFRSDLKKSSINIERGQTTQKKIAKDMKVKPCEVQKLERIAKHNPKLLKEIGTTLTTDQAYQQVSREMEEKNATSKIKKFVSKVTSIVSTLFFKIYVKSSHNMDEVKPNSVKCIVTSPPYYLQRKYSKNRNEIGQEVSPSLYIKRLANHLTDCKRVLTKDGSMFLNLGDSIIGKRQQLIPEKVAIELEKQGFILRQRIIWKKTNGMSKGNSSMFTPQCESILWLVKSLDFDHNVVTVPVKTKNKKPGVYNHKNTDGTRRNGSPISTNATRKNIRDFWNDEVIETASCHQKSIFLPKGTDHAAPFPVGIPNICIAKVCQPGDTVLDPFCGSGTTGEAALMNGCNFIGYELMQKSANITKYRLQKCQEKLVAESADKRSRIETLEPTHQLDKAA